MKLFWSKETIYRKFIQKMKVTPGEIVKFKMNGEEYSMTSNQAGTGITHHPSRIVHILLDEDGLTYWQAAELFKFMKNKVD